MGVNVGERVGVVRQVNMGERMGGGGNGSK